MVSGPVQIIVELLLNGVWVDISRFVYQRDIIDITGGKQDESAGKPQPARMALTLNNRDGRFTPKNTSGAYYPYLAADTPVRMSVTYTSSTGNFYSGYRFSGKVPAWPPLSDPTGVDVYVHLVAAGPLRKLRQGGGKGSALTRYYSALTGSFAPVAYWPCEEDPDATIIGSNLQGGTNMAVTSGTPTWKAISKFNGSGPVAVLNKSTWDGLTGSFSNSGDDIYSTPGSFTWVASTSTVNAK